MSQKNRAEGPSQATKTVNAVAAVVALVALLFCGIKLADKVTAGKAAGDIAESSMPTGGLEFRNAEEAPADKPDEELLAERVSGSIVVVSGDGERSIGVVIAKAGFVLTDLSSADTAEDCNGIKHALTDRETVEDGLYLFRMENSDGLVPLRFGDTGNRNRIYVFSAAANGFMLKGYDVTCSSECIESEDRLPDGFCVIIGTEGEFVAAGIPTVQEDGHMAVENNAGTIRVLANSKDNVEL